MNRKRLSHWLIGLGLFLVLLTLAWMALGYPWGMLFGDRAPLADPPPLHQEIAAQPPPDSDVENPLGIDNAPGFFAQRPPVSLTPLGLIKIPKIRLSENIVCGAGDELYYAVGHLPGSAAPGEAGNCVLAGHRNYLRMRPFRHLDKLETGDTIEVSAGGATYSYTIYNTTIVSPQESAVMQPQEGHEAVLTLITCTPVIGMQNRLIVWAELQ